MTATTPEITSLINTYLSDRRSHENGNPWVMLNMIASSNGLATINGSSGSLGGPADKALFKALRSTADIILVGYRTVFDEQYGPPVLTDELIDARKSKGKSPLPLIAVISNRLEIDVDLPLFRSKEYQPILVTSLASSKSKRMQLESCSDVFICGDKVVDLRKAIFSLAGRHGKVILVEGGPSLNKQLVDEDVFDELCITTSPYRSEDEASDVVTTGSSYDEGLMETERVIKVEDFTFTRFTRTRGKKI